MKLPESPLKKKPGAGGGGKPSFPHWRFSLGYFALMIFMLIVWQSMLDQIDYKPITYSQFKERLAQGELTEVQVRERDIIGKGRLKNPPKVTEGAPPISPDFNFRAVRVEDPKLVEELQAHKVNFRGVLPNFLQEFVFSWLLPLGVMIVLWMLLARRIGAAGQSVLSFGRSKAKVYADSDTGVTFADVAGCDEAKYELEEVVDFLKNPDRYRQLGAKIPKGVLLIGPPGTGKTLLARAVAGEAKVRFFSLSGSEFVEMFVGVGASRVRDLFLQAKQQAPCIIFIDELDAIGRQRGVHVGAVHDEREQTLNQLLVEMDGFEANVGVIVLAATNRPDVLDRALLRPGRFDRQVVVDAPDAAGREAILKVHSRDKPLGPDTNLKKIAQATPGFSGADLANALNEAALLAARRMARQIEQQDLQEAIEKVVAGPERKSKRLNEETRRRVAYHEAGHAITSAFSPGADPVHKISIIPRGSAALGYTLQLPSEDQYVRTRGALIDRIKTLLGGRAAEELIYNEVSTGAENDLDHATALVQRMVCMYGMGESVGLVHVGQRGGPMYMEENSLQRDCSDDTGREIDREIRKILDDAYAETKKILTEQRDKLEAVATELLAVETLDAAAFFRLVGIPLPSGDGKDGKIVAVEPNAPATAAAAAVAGE